jgi:hypothetical protein
VTCAEQSGAIVWSGRSRLDRKSPIVVLVTWQTANTGTGPMVQSWILRSDVHPTEAIRHGYDSAVCPTSCGLRPATARELGTSARCYAAHGRTAAALPAMFRSLPRYPRITPRVAAMRLTGQRLRIGAYGDPAAVPVSVWSTLLTHTAGHTGYTHAPDRAPLLKPIVMASCESEAEAERLQAQGWRTYRMRQVDAQGRPEPLLPGELKCPKTHEGGQRTACAWCLGCDGTEGKIAKSYAAIDHSSTAMRRRRASGDLALPVTLRRSKGGASLAL